MPNAIFIYPHPIRDRIYGLVSVCLLVSRRCVRRIKPSAGLDQLHTNPHSEAESCENYKSTKCPPPEWIRRTSTLSSWPRHWYRKWFGHVWTPKSMKWWETETMEARFLRRGALPLICSHHAPRPTQQDLNPQHPDLKAGALPIELWVDNRVLSLPTCGFRVASRAYSIAD